MPVGNFHLAAFRGSVANGTTNTPIAGVFDDMIARNASSNFLAPSGAQIRMAVAGGVNASRARFDIASLREVGLSYIAPLQTGITALAPPNVSDYYFGGIPLRPSEELSVQSTHTDAAPQIQWALAWLMFRREEVPPARKWRLRFTAAITGVVGSWAAGALTLDQTLPPGRYRVVGMDVFGTNLLGARLIFQGGGYRPGVLARNAVGSQPSPKFQDETLGVFGDFDNVSIPQLETYVEAANTAQEGYLDVQKIGA